MLNVIPQTAQVESGKGKMYEKSKTLPLHCGVCGADVSD